jgi:hypothetical protein
MKSLPYETYPIVKIFFPHKDTNLIRIGDPSGGGGG